MRTLEYLAEARTIIARMNPTAFYNRIDEWRRGGLPSTSIPEGSRSSATPLPLPDRIDRELAGAKREHREAAEKILELAVRMEQLENTIAALPHDEASKLAAELIAPKAQNCTNCKRPVERTSADPLYGGRCRNCHDYLKAHGIERLKELWEAEIDRRARRLAGRGIQPAGR